ncbi:uncharacterized protein MELLADRAFT_101231 [Melampsora larici-populina 98AG31]|uniref:Uncharacterized protein n=1 Tax=Melampsora larici-populina (strain 98AG31 / pathotype 3-4-7) TaxID=747676 RepID=F4R423_MELLP|nr:uncharacterized protein MELLADRAFT_101231 [Melampsora larici-populina 98AG31]EGG12726.1 hypothetical protein MELLADRAFT_101231 [Melampsora larici-populina 98AG31]
MAQESNPGGSTIILILNQADQLTQEFKKIYNESINFVQGLKSTEQQFENLNNLNQRQSQSSILPSPSNIVERTFNKLNQTKVEFTMKIIESLNLLESIIDRLSQLLYSIDIEMIQIESSNGFDPKNAVDHLNLTFDAYQAELVSKRQVFSSFNSEEISLDEFLFRWMRTDELSLLNKETMDDLSDCLKGWST